MCAVCMALFARAVCVCAVVHLQAIDGSPQAVQHYGEDGSEQQEDEHAQRAEQRA